MTKCVFFYPRQRHVNVCGQVCGRDLDGHDAGATALLGGVVAGLWVVCCRTSVAGQVASPTANGRFGCPILSAPAKMTHLSCRGCPEALACPRSTRDSWNSGAEIHHGGAVFNRSKDALCHTSVPHLSHKWILDRYQFSSTFHRSFASGGR